MICIIFSSAINIILRLNMQQNSLLPSNPIIGVPIMSSSSSSDDEDIVAFVNHITAPRRERVYRTRNNHFEKWDDEDFYDRFRLSKKAVFLVLQQIRHFIQWPTKRNKALNASEMLLLTLRFLATNSFLISAGDFIGIHKTTAGKHVWRVLKAIAQLRKYYVKMPREDNINNIKKAFYSIAKFPNVIGALDCTHIKIESPGGAQAETFRCRKQFFSFNVQVICNSSLIIQDIVARWPGSAHDSRIFQNSKIRERLESGEFGNGVLMVDSGYAVTRYCLTPLADPQTQAEELYNESQIRTRNPIERTFGVIKRRFPILALGIRLSLKKVQYICVVTAILHNIAIELKDGEPPQLPEQIEETILNTNNVTVDPFPQRSIDRRIKPYITYFNILLRS